MLKKLKYALKYLSAKIEGNEQYIQHLKSLQNDVTVKKDEQIIYFVGDKNYLPPIIDKKENQPLKITSLDAYRVALDMGIKDFDFSDLNVDGENIQNLDLENLNLNINLRQIFVPYNDSLKCGNAIFYNWGHYGDCFLHLNKANLKGNTVEGELSFFSSEIGGNVYFWYTEDTFDEIYKQKYSKYFLDNSAPIELKNKYYNPNIVTKVQSTVFKPKGEEITYLKRQILSFEEYLQYYQFLNGKYLDNFEISEIDYVKITIIEKYGLEQARKIFANLSQSILPIDNCFQLLFKMNELNLSDTSMLKNKTNNSLEVEKILQAIDNTKQLKLVNKK